MVVYSREFAILRMFRSATTEQVQDGIAWYDTARAYAVSLARQYRVTKQCAAGVIAALSPQLSWNSPWYFQTRSNEADIHSQTFVIHSFSQNTMSRAIGR